MAEPKQDSVRKRKLANQDSCAHCKRDKKRCDEGMPCQRCSRRGWLCSKTDESGNGKSYLEDQVTGKSVSAPSKPILECSEKTVKKTKFSLAYIACEECRLKKRKCNPTTLGPCDSCLQTESICLRRPYRTARIN
jgi:hypothetical protein